MAQAHPSWPEFQDGPGSSPEPCLTLLRQMGSWPGVASPRGRIWAGRGRWYRREQGVVAAFYLRVSCVASRHTLVLAHL